MFPLLVREQRPLFFAWAGRLDSLIPLLLLLVRVWCIVPLVTGMVDLRGECLGNVLLGGDWLVDSFHSTFEQVVSSLLYGFAVVLPQSERLFLLALRFVVSLQVCVGHHIDVVLSAL